MNLRETAARLGIDSTFTDGTGQTRTIGDDTLQVVIDALSASGDSDAVNNLLILKTPGQLSASELHAKLSHLGGWRVLDDTGEVLATSASDVGALTHGVFWLQSGESSSQTALIVAPETAYAGEFSRGWILAVQLYGVRSERNWGVGDFTDLQTLLRWAASIGAAGIGLNPLHALFDDEPDDCSPYSPNSRLFLNSIYIDVAQIPELPQSFAIDHAELIDQLQRSELVDYPAVADLKQRALRAAFAQFKSRTTLRRRSEFDEFRRAGGVLLSRFACFEVLRRKYRGGWWEWPARWRRPDDDALAQLRAGEDSADIEFIEFVQWCADRQLEACTGLAKELGLAVGLYLDVAVGVKAGGFDAWNEQCAISHRLSIGAPPDALNTAGQDWGLAGYNAAGLEARLFAPFRQMLAASMRYASAIRLDHVLGLNRIYVVPNGAPPDRGVYVNMPFEAMLALVAIESRRYRCIVIGEDLGTVPDGFREKMSSWGIWSYRVMMFERVDEGRFRPVDDYPANALATFNTHDLPTFAGWRTAHDISLKNSLQIDPGESHDQRHHAVGLLADTLREAGHQDNHFHGVLAHLANTSSRLLGVSVEDLMGVVEQTNVPGTTNEHPNWRRRLPFMVESWDRHIDVDALRQALQVRNSLT